MKAKLQHLIKSEGLTASRFAEMLEIQPAGVSHILAGRNKPSFDLLQKILRRFPKINPDWLLLDSDQMYREGWNDDNSVNGSAASNGSLGASRISTNGGSTQNSGMPFGSLFSGANNVGQNGPANPGASNFGTTNHNLPNGGMVGTNGGATGNAYGGAQNLSLGGANISGMTGIDAGISHSRAGYPVDKIVVFYADGTFEAYSPASK